MNRPKIIINVASSLDGIIASHNKALSLSNQEDWIRVHKLRNEVDAILVGVNTVINDNPQLTVRLITPKTPHPFRIVLDSKGRIPLSSNILKNQNLYPTILFVSSEIPNNSKNKLREVGINIVEIPSVFSEFLPLPSICDILKHQFNVNKLLVEGGSTIITQFIANNFVDELNIFYSPIFIGDRGGIPLFSLEAVKNVEEGFSFDIVSFKAVGNGVLLALQPKEV